MCGKGISIQSVIVEADTPHIFKTQKGKRYPRNTNCAVKFKIGSTCSEISFDCKKVSIVNRDKKKCRKGDKLTITTRGKTKVYVLNKTKKT